MHMATNMDQSNNLVIGNGVTFKGTLNVPKKATIYGTVDGELTAEEIFIGQSGKIKGKVTARSIEVEGELHQVIHCRDHLHIRATGKVSGKLEYSQIQIERGGEFRGEMQQVGAAPVYPPNSAAAAAAKPGANTPPATGATPTSPAANKDAST
jgi:cytoskeletal protein CcmA (bactofilin family)